MFLAGQWPPGGLVCGSATGFYTASVGWAELPIVCRAQRGRWRPQADDMGLTLTLILVLACPAGLTGRALLLFLTSPRRLFLDRGRPGTV
jgi:hypothetical protein